MEIPPYAVIAAGVLLLVAGRKLFWLFIAVTGFLVGVEVAKVLFVEQPAWVVWVFAAGAGLLGALLAILFERVAFALAGFYAGGYLALVCVKALGWPLSDLAVFATGGVIAAIIATLVLDWAIIVLSALVGAGMIVTNLGLEPLASGAVAGGLATAGILLQAAMMKGKLGKPVR